MDKPYYNADMAYDEVKKYGDRLKIKLVVDGKESVFDMSGIVVDVINKIVNERLEAIVAEASNE